MRSDTPIEEALADAINRRAVVETALYDMAAGKRPLPDADACRDLARKLGVPGTVRHDEFARLRAENERLRAATLALTEGAGAAIRRIADPDAAADLSAAVREARAALNPPGA